MAKRSKGAQAPLTIVYWAPRRGARSPVRKDIEKMATDVRVAFDAKIQKLATEPENQPGVKKLRYVSRLGEIKVDGAHGYHRFIVRIEGDYVIVLDAFKKKGNSTPTSLATERWLDWKRRLATGDV